MISMISMIFDMLDIGGYCKTPNCIQTFSKQVFLVSSTTRSVQQNLRIAVVIYSGI